MCTLLLHYGWCFGLTVFVVRMRVKLCLGAVVRWKQMAECCIHCSS